MKQYLFLQLNEINFGLVREYLSNEDKYRFPNLRGIIENFAYSETASEKKYENLEPWIQWVSIQTGKSFKEHQVFRLGDIVSNKQLNQFFEEVKNNGYRVGAVSPMNADNRMKTSAYFIPDPWTDTESDGSPFSKRLTSMLRQSVNDNAKGSLTLASILTLFESVFRTFHIRRTSYLMKLVFSVIKSPWKKSLVLDYLIHLVHLKFFKIKKPDFSSVFFNAGAHIQHHYFFNSKYVDTSLQNPKWYINQNADPIADMLEVYDKILGDYLSMMDKDTKIMIATGLQQVPFDFVKYYYRLSDHNTFLKKIGINCKKVLPRMTRDFEIIFDKENDMNDAIKALESVKSIKDDTSIFREIEVRDKSLFVTLTYPHEIKQEDQLEANGELMSFFDEVVFVAIKNGMHDSKGYAYFSKNMGVKSSDKPIHVSKLHGIIMKNFPKRVSG